MKTTLIMIIACIVIVFVYSVIMGYVELFDTKRYVVKHKTCNGCDMPIFVEYGNVCELQSRNKINMIDDNYIDVDAFAGYGCLLDNATKKYYRNFDNFPLTNGPPL